MCDHGGTQHDTLLYFPPQGRVAYLNALLSLLAYWPGWRQNPYQLPNDAQN